MFFRRYLFGWRPVLVWAEDEEAADRTAVVHALCLQAVWQERLEGVREDDT